MRVGMIGIGLMGHGIASNILKAGHDLKFLDHAGNQPTDDLLSSGAERVSSHAEVVKGVGVLLLCVTGAPQVRKLLIEEGGAIERLQSEQIVIDCSTSLPETSQQVAAELSKKSIRFADAAMTRTPKEAAEGRLNLIVGADQDLFTDIKALLECFAENIVHAGPVGSGHLMKLVHNYVSLGFSAVLAEAAHVAQKENIDPGVFLDVVGKGGGGGVVFDRFAPFISDRDCSGFQFALANAAKDLGYYNGMLKGGEHSLIIAEAVQRVFDQALEKGHGEKSVPELIDVLDR